MSAKPRVHEVASELGVPAKDVMKALRNMGEYVKGPSSSIEPAVARRVKAALPPAPPVFPALHDERLAAHIAALPRQMPELVDLLLQGTAVTEDVPALINEAASSRNFYFVPARAFEPLSLAAKATLTMQQGDLIARTGVVIIAHPVTSDRRQRFQLLAWVERSDRLHLATTTLIASNNGQGNVTATRTLSSSHKRYVKGYTELGALNMGRTLAALRSLLPVRNAPGIGVPPRAGVPVAQVPTGETQVIYATRSILAAGLAEHEGSGAARSSRWIVSGHWRDQWYPSVKDRKRIWINEHEAGATDGQLRQADRVYIVAPRNI